MASSSTHKSFNVFYELSDPLSASAFRGEVRDVAVYEEIERASRGIGGPSQVPRIMHSMGGKLCDFIWVSLVPIIHQRVVDLLTSGEVTGWSSYPVLVIDREGREVKDYHGLCVTGRCGSIFVDRQRAEVVYRELPGGRFPYYRGLHITTESWDGSDMFTAADGKTGWVVVSEKVKHLFVKARVSNVRLTPISEIETPAEDQPSFAKPATGKQVHDRPH
jgi:hypothetical protein